MVVENSLFQDNRAATHGGGLYLYDTHSPVEIVGSSVVSNEADERAGGVAVRLVSTGELLRINARSSRGSARA